MYGGYVPTFYVLVQLFVIVVVSVGVVGGFGAAAAEEVYLWEVAECHGVCFVCVCVECARIRL